MTTNNVISIQNRFRNDIERQYRNRMIRRLSEALMRSFAIHEGDDFVLALGQGNEANNLEAMQTWVRSNLLDQGLPPTKGALPELTSLLDMHFQEVMEVRS